MQVVPITRVWKSEKQSASSQISALIDAAQLPVLPGLQKPLPTTWTEVGFAETRIAKRHAEAASVMIAADTNAFPQHENISATTVFVLHGAGTPKFFLTNFLRDPIVSLLCLAVFSPETPCRRAAGGVALAIRVNRPDQTVVIPRQKSSWALLITEQPAVIHSVNLAPDAQ